ncbi:MAG: methyltransferase domain-containing protein, partial [Chloroflexota bacterium]|nr:methyltransferase domain-containing protein [Chloroflexota bacterium]
MSTQATPNPAQVYDDFLVPNMFEPWADELLARVAITPGDRVLDVACGTGAVTRKAAAIAGADGTTTGIDISPPMLGILQAHARRAGVDIQPVERSADSLPFDDGTFDVVLCQQGLQFVPDRQMAVREMHRVLRDGGRAGVSIWRDAEHQGLLGAISEAIDRQFGTPANDPFRMGDADEVRDLFARAGFSDIAIEPVRRRVRFPSADQLVRLSVMSAAAVLPELAEASDDEREAAIAAIREDIHG